MNKKVNIICMKWGDKFPPFYVNRLYGMISRNITLPFQLTCFTDNAEGIREEVKIEPIPIIELPDGIPERGWKKLTVLENNLGGLSGQILFLDLDVLIVNNIDSFFSHSGDFLIAHDKKRPKKIEGNSSVFRFNIGQHNDVLDFFKKNVNSVKQQFRHEQAYLSKQIYDKKKSKLHTVFWENWSHNNSVNFINLYDDFKLLNRDKLITQYFIPGDVHWNKDGHKYIYSLMLKHYFNDK